MLDIILCVDDDLITLMLCKKVIEKVDFAKTIHTSQNGEEAIQYFNSLFEEKKIKDTNIHPSIVFLDLNMPVINGWEFLEIYHEKDYHNEFDNTKFIIISSTIDPQDVNKSKKYPIVIDFFSKPITKEMLDNLKTKLL